MGPLVHLAWNDPYIVLGLIFHDLITLQAPSAIRPPVSIGAAKPASQVSNTGIPEPQIVKLENGGYMAEFEINDLPARFNFLKIFFLNYTHKKMKMSVIGFTRGAGS